MNKPVIIVSECLLGLNCRYKGDNCKNEDVLSLSKKAVLLGVCPEQMGGLETPRDPSEIIGDSVISKSGKDVTFEYNKGAEASLFLAKTNNVKYAVLKARSPSCGKGLIYDGSFSGKLTEGNGVCADLFIKNGIRVFTENEIPELLSILEKEETL